MLHRKSVLLNPDLRRYIILRTYRGIIKETSKLQDSQIRNNITQIFLPVFRKNKQCFNYREYNRLILNAEKLHSYLYITNTEFPKPSGMYFSYSKAYRNLIKEAYGLKGIIKEQIEKTHVDKLDAKKKLIYRIYRTKQFNELKDLWKNYIDIPHIQQISKNFQDYPEVLALYAKLIGENIRLKTQESQQKLTIID